jgi:CPA1 family monovalent cation:H+ antiporter
MGGLLVGLAVAWLVAHLQRRVIDPAIEIAVSLLTPFGAYILAEQLHVSGVLATVAAGLCAGWWAPRMMAPETRLRSRAVCDVVAFLLNGLVFILIGLQLLRILPALATRSLEFLVGLGLAISVAVILVRFAWVFGPAGLGAILGRQPDTSPIGARGRAVLSWAGMRGVVSLATALALPLETPERDLLVFVTFCVILVTLVGQGLTLPSLVAVLGFPPTVGPAPRSGAPAESRPTWQSPDDELAAEWPNHQPLIDALRAEYTHRGSHLDDLAKDYSPDAAERELLEHRHIRRAVLEAEREAMLNLRRQGALDDEAWRHIERDLDLEALRLDA